MKMRQGGMVLTLPHFAFATLGLWPPSAGCYNVGFQPTFIGEIRSSNS